MCSIIVEILGGGGVAIYANCKYRVFKIECASVIEDYIESVFVSVDIGDIKYVIGCIYRLPKSNLMRFFDKLENILELLSNSFPHNKLLLSGDFNIDLIPYESNAVCTNFLSLAFSYNCIPR